MGDKATNKRPIEVQDNQRQNNPYAKSILGKCYQCNQPGHRWNDCPIRKTVNIIEQGKEEEIYELDGGDKYYDNDNDGVQQICVIRKLMLA